MIALAHFILFFGFALALVALYICIQAVKHSKAIFARPYLVILSGITFIIFIHVLEAFFKAVLSGEAYDATFRTPFLYLIILLVPVRLFIAAKAVEVGLLLKQKRPGKWIYAFPAATFILFIVSVIILNFPTELKLRIDVRFTYSIHLISMGALIYTGFQFLKASDCTTKDNFKHFRMLGAVLIIFATGNLIFRTLNYPHHRIHEDLQMLGLAIFDVVLMSSQIFLLKNIFSTKHIPEEAARDIEAVFEKYQITSREKEIIKLICEGKTNKEIAEQLFISPVTVRDHSSNIYRKTEVKNRTQLAALFRKYY